MKANALQKILDLQRKVDIYERFHLDLLFMLKSRQQINIPKIEDEIADWVYSEVLKLIEERNEK